MNGVWDIKGHYRPVHSSATKTPYSSVAEAIRRYRSGYWFDCCNQSDLWPQTWSHSCDIHPIHNRSAHVLLRWPTPRLRLCCSASSTACDTSGDWSLSRCGSLRIWTRNMPSLGHSFWMWSKHMIGVRMNVQCRWHMTMSERKAISRKAQSMHLRPLCVTVKTKMTAILKKSTGKSDPYSDQHYVRRVVIVVVIDVNVIVVVITGSAPQQLVQWQH